MVQELTWASVIGSGVGLPLAVAFYYLHVSQRDSVPTTEPAIDPGQRSPRCRTASLLRIDVYSATWRPVRRSAAAARSAPDVAGLSTVYDTTPFHLRCV